jgi:hypothetical protein
VAERSRRRAARAYREGTESEAREVKPVTTIRRADICVEETCGHPSCVQARADARAKCAKCSKYVAFRPYLENPDGPGVVHRACLEQEFKQAVVKAVFIREPYFRLELACNHRTFIKSTTGKIPKMTRCSECKHTVRDAYGNRRLMPMKAFDRRQSWSAEK